MNAPQLQGRSDSLRPLLGVGVVVFLVLAVGGLKSYRDLETARARQRQLEVQIKDEKQGLERLRGRIERLRSDPATLERLARENLGMVRPGDVLIELPRETAPSPAAPVPAALPSNAAPAAQPPASPSSLAAPPPASARAPG